MYGITELFQNKIKEIRVGKAHIFCQIGCFFSPFLRKKVEKHPNLVLLGVFKKRKLKKTKNKKQTNKQINKKQNKTKIKPTN